MPTLETADLAHRLREVREELYGKHGGPLLAEAMRIPLRTLLHYESGVTMPAVMLLRFIRITGACPKWLMSGLGLKYTPCGDANPVTGRQGVSDPAIGP